MIQKMIPYDWQEKLIHHEGNTTTKGGRQTGKSWAIADRIKYWAEKVPGSTSLILAASERQENFLLFKVKTLFGEKYKYKERATLSYLRLQNGSVIYKYPIGQTGIYVEGMSSVDFIYIDEAIHVGERVFDSIIPMLAEPRKRGYGWLNLLSATRGKAKGTFKESFEGTNYLKTSIRAEDCPHISKEFLAEELLRLGKRMYGIIYNGDFDIEGHKYFSKEQIMGRVNIKTWRLNQINRGAQYYLGIDPARYGKSKAAFASTQLQKDSIDLIHGEEYQKTSLWDLQTITVKLDRSFHYKTLFIDDGGFGGGLPDILIHYEENGKKIFKRRLRELNNKSTGKEKFNKILKEDLYSNLMYLIESKKIRIVNDPLIIKGLLDIEFDENDKIIGTDMSEASVRACWAWKEKRLKTIIRTF